jgi:hypothetical protein
MLASLAEGEGWRTGLDAVTTYGRIIIKSQDRSSIYQN